ncbi:MAG: SH3 domain-containing protein [Treponema sp.]|nr:SH3 domain-containing protein [Treponema sp.]
MMKKPFFCAIAFFAVAFAALTVLAVTAVAQNSGTTLYVAVETVTVRSSTGFFSSALGTFRLGEAVTVQQNQGRWLSVRGAGGLQGWAPADAFSARPRAGQAGANVTTAEFALAGKGFSSNLEEMLLSSGPLDFAAVDAMERRAVHLEELRSFLREGRLAEGN